MEKPIFMIRKCYNQAWLVIFISFSVCLALLFSFDISESASGRHIGYTYLLTFAKPKPLTLTPLDDNNQLHYQKNTKHTSSQKNISGSDSCLGLYIYVHDLPSQFNDDFFKNCKLLNKWIDMCPSIENSGLGPKVENPEEVLLRESWFLTNQFMLEEIFKNRMKQYKCLTNDSSLASAIYVPFYAGLDIGRYLWDYNTSVRDSSGFRIAKWLAEKPEWKRMSGRDHFFVAGRIGWDFRRQTNNDSDWGSRLMYLPQFMNMTMLTIESTSWSNEFAIPYPTYFHPSSQKEVVEWQQRMRHRERKHLFSFAGAPRPAMQDSIRGEIIKQCNSTSGRTCKLLDCYSTRNVCDNPVEVIKVFQDSIFCLQPPGDSFTRRSTFDSILSGCIPVFFHPGSAYAQYTWYFPKNYTKYSMFIPKTSFKGGKVNITETLLGVSKDDILAMREEVIALIPKIVYGDPRGVEKLQEDAFSIAVKEVLQRVDCVRRRINEGQDPSIDFAQENTWKSRLSGTGRDHEFDQFF